MQYGRGFTEMIQCGEDERREIVPVIDTIVQLAEQARRDGLLSLEEAIDDIDHYFLRRGLTLVVDGIEPEIIREALSRLLFSERRKEKEVLKRMIMLEGVMAIQAGMNPTVMRFSLSAFLGEGLAEEQDETSL